MFMDHAFFVVLDPSVLKYGPKVSTPMSPLNEPFMCEWHKELLILIKSALTLNHQPPPPKCLGTIGFTMERCASWYKYKLHSFNALGEKPCILLVLAIELIKCASVLIALCDCILQFNDEPIV